jgi:hypothetical protein
LGLVGLRGIITSRRRAAGTGAAALLLRGRAPAAMWRNAPAMMKRRLGPCELLGRASPCVSIREGVESPYEPAANESGHLIR